MVMVLGKHAHKERDRRPAGDPYVFGFTFHAGTLARGTLRAGEGEDLFEIFFKVAGKARGQCCCNALKSLLWIASPTRMKTSGLRSTVVLYTFLLIGIHSLQAQRRRQPTHHDGPPRPQPRRIQAAHGGGKVEISRREIRRGRRRRRTRCCRRATASARGCGAGRWCGWRIFPRCG